MFDETINEGNMEKRKLMALGKSSLVIAIPKHWLNKSELKRGDFVSLSVQSDGSLCIHPETNAGKNREINLYFSAEDDENSIIRHVISCYLNGFTTIRLLSKSVFTTKQHVSARNVVKTLYMRIMESNSRKITINVLLDESMSSVFNGIERMHIITHSMCTDILGAMKNWDEDIARSVVSLEDDVDQFMYLLLRLIRRAAQNSSLAHDLGLGMIDCMDCQTLIHRVEQVADHVTNIAGSLVFLFETQIHLPKDVLNIIIEAAGLAFTSYDRAVQSFLLKNADETNEIIDNEREVERLIEEIIPIPYQEVENKLIPCNIVTILESIKRISEYTSDIAEITIDRTYNL